MADTWADITQQHTAPKIPPASVSPGRGGAKRVPPPTVKPEGFWHGAARETVNSLPAIGATVGGTVATPTDVVTLGVPVGTAVGAGLGAGVGEAARQTLLNWFPSLGKAPQTTQDAVMETGKQMLIGGATEGVTPAVENIFGMLAPGVKKTAAYVGTKLKDSGAKALVGVMRPVGTMAEANAQEAANTLIDRPASDYVSATRGQFERRAAAKQAMTGKAVGSAEDAVKGDVIPQNLIGEMNQSIAAYRNKMYMPQVNVLGAAGPVVQEGPYVADKLAAIDNIQQIVDNAMPAMQPNPQTGALELVPGAGNLSRESLRAAKKFIDDDLKVTGSFDKASAARTGAQPTAELARATEAKKKMADILRETMNKDKPDIAKLNNDYHLWSNVVNVMSPATFKEGIEKDPSVWQRAWHVRFGMWLAKSGAASAGVGAATHYIAPGLQVEAAEATGALLALGTAMQSTAWRTVSAATKSKIADAMANKQFENVARLATEAVIKSSTPAARVALRPNPPVSSQSASTVKMKTPDGTVRSIPTDKVDEAKKRGAVVIQ